MPRWRADYFDNPKDDAPSRSEVIVADNELDALSAQQDGFGLLSGRGD